MKWRQRIGLWRSIAIYYLKPFNQRRLRNFYRQFVGPGDICFDVGSHLGNRAQAFLALGAEVIAIEPQPMCVAYLKNKFNNNPRFNLIQKAVGTSPGKLTMHISHSAPTISTFSGAAWRQQVGDDTGFNVDWNEQITVECTTLDQLISEYGVPSFCKIDVENYEAQVLKGLSTAIPALSFEYYPPFTNETALCIDHLSELGNYEYNWSFGESQRFNSGEWISPDNMKTILSSYTRSSEYGDVYARQIQQERLVIPNR